MLEAAQCTFDITGDAGQLSLKQRMLRPDLETTHNMHAYEIAKEISFEYDAVMSLSGDGLIHEIFNGYAHHKEPMKAFQIPVVPIPTGSGNGLSLNILGLKVREPLVMHYLISVHITAPGRLQCSSRSVECD